MGVAGSADIFQSKMSELMAALEFIRTYWDDLLCITRASLEVTIDLMDANVFYTLALNILARSYS